MVFHQCHPCSNCRADICPCIILSATTTDIHAAWIRNDGRLAWRIHIDLICWCSEIESTIMLVDRKIEKSVKTLCEVGTHIAGIDLRTNQTVSVRDLGRERCCRKEKVAIRKSSYFIIWCHCDTLRGSCTPHHKNKAKEGTWEYLKRWRCGS